MADRLQAGMKTRRAVPVNTRADQAGAAGTEFDEPLQTFAPHHGGGMAPCLVAAAFYNARTADHNAGAAGGRRKRRGNRQAYAGHGQLRRQQAGSD